MAYTKQNFENGQVLTAEALEKIEDGILGCAPGGYGLGGEITDIGATSVDNISGTGWYWGYNGLPDGFGYSPIHHIERNANYITQIAYSLTNVSNWGAICVRREKTGGVWQPWEWENPPMVADVEYRTTERYNGKPVYTKLVDFGYLPDATERRVAFTKDGERVQVVSLNGRAYEDDGEGVYFINYSEGFPFYANGSLQADAYTSGDLYSDRTAIIVNAHTNCTMFYAMFVVKYVKD